MKFKEYNLSQKSARCFFVIFLFILGFCGYSTAQPRNSTEAMKELDWIKQGGAPKGGMDQQDFMKMVEDNYSDEDKKILCENNLKRIRAAKESYINDNLDRLDEIKEITEEMLEQYIRGGFSSLACISGGEFIIGGKDTAPTCSIHSGLDSE